jgi:ADP-heptose:LPS heptosyltransferase
MVNVTKNIELVSPANLVSRKYNRRIIIHCTSRAREKNWSLKKFIKLAHKLERDNWEPVFTLSVAEEKEYAPILSRHVKVKSFPDLNKFAQYVFESGFMLGNDSGTGHLASCLGLPTLTITSVSRNSGFRWRPSWSCGEVVRPVFKLKINKKAYWKSFLSVNRVYKAFKKLTAKCKS